MVKKIILTLFLFAAVIQVSFTQDKILLNFRLPQGLRYISEYDINTVINQEIMGINQQIEMQMLMRIQNIVESQNDSGNIVSMSYKRLAIETMTPSGRVQVDSDSPEEQSGKEFLKNMTGKKFTVFFDPSGTVKEIRGLEKIIDEITADIASDNPLVESYKNTLNDAFGEVNIKNNLNQITPFFPPYPLGTGDSWTWEMVSRTAQFEFQLINTSTLKETGNEKVMVQTNSVITAPENKVVNIDGMDAILHMKGQQVSELYIDPKTGLSTEGVIQQTINGELRLIMPDHVTEKLIVPINISTRINLTVNFK